MHFQGYTSWRAGIEWKIAKGVFNLSNNKLTTVSFILFSSYVFQAWKGMALPGLRKKVFWTFRNTGKSQEGLCSCFLYFFCSCLARKYLFWAQTRSACAALGAQRKENPVTQSICFIFAKKEGEEGAVEPKSRTLLISTHFWAITCRLSAKNLLMFCRLSWAETAKTRWSYSQLQIKLQRILRLILNLCRCTRILHMGFTMSTM